MPPQEEEVASNKPAEIKPEANEEEIKQTNEELEQFEAELEAEMQEEIAAAKAARKKRNKTNT